MKKKKIMICSIIVVIMLISIFSTGNYSKLLSKLKGDISGVTSSTYKDWSSLTSIDNDYSYSTLIYTKDTKFYVNMTPNDDAEEYKSSVKIKTSIIDNNIPSPYITLYGLNSKAQLIITDCAIDKDGNLLDAVLEVENIEKWLDHRNYRMGFGIGNVQKMRTDDQRSPDISNKYTAYKVKENDILTFALTTRLGISSVKLTYYKDLKLKNIEEGKYTELYDGETDESGTASISYAEVDEANSVIDTNIKKVNSFYNDIDITKDEDYGSDYSNEMFYGKEGLAPTIGDNEIYYDTVGYSGEYPDYPYDGSNTYNVKLNKYEDLSKNIHGIYVQQDDFSEVRFSDTYDLGLQGIWYGTSTEVLTSNLNGEYDFIYGGTNNGIWFSFFSPIGYTMDKNIKEVDKTSALTTDTFTYTIKQYIPNNYYTNVIDFSTAYNNFTSNNFLSEFKIEDQINNELTIDTNNITITDVNNTDLTNKFSINVTNNKLTATLTDSSYLRDLSFYNNLIIINVPVSKQTVLNSKKTYTNTATSITKIEDGDSISLTSNPVITEVSSPKVIYDCKNGETTHQEEYLNPNSSIDLTKTCIKENSVFRGWSEEENSRNTNDSMTIGRTDKTIYAVYKQNIVVSTDNQSKVYDGTPLIANNRCSIKTGELLDGDSISCINSGSITNVGNTIKTIDIVTITDSTGNDVTSQYSIMKQNGTLVVTGTDTSCPIVTNYSGVYDGNSHTIDVIGGSGGTIQYRTNTTENWSDEMPTRKSKGTTTVYIRVFGDENHNTMNCDEASITITPKPITVKATNQEKIYDGSELKATENDSYKCKITNGSLVAGETFSCVSSGTITNVGTKNKTLDSVEIKNSGGTSTTDNYTITKINGELKVTPKPIIVVADNQEKIYDKTPLNANEKCHLESDNLVGNDRLSCSNTGSQTEVGSSIKTLQTAIVLDEDGNNVSNNYSIEKKNGTLTVKPLINEIRLDNKGANSEGTKKIFEYCDKAIYLDVASNIAMNQTENPIELPEKNGYTFGGYYTEDNGNGTQMINENGYITTNLTYDVCTSGRVFYAKWIPKIYTLTVIYNNGKENDIYELEYKEEKIINNPTKDDHVFIKWNLTGKGSRISNELFVMGYENAVIEAVYENSPVDCDVIINSSKYFIDQNTKTIYVPQNNTIENIKNNITSKGLIVEINDSEIVVRCESNEEKYKISRILIPQTGQKIIKYGYILSFITVIIALLIIVLQKKKKEL